MRICVQSAERNASQPGRAQPFWSTQIAQAERGLNFAAWAELGGPKRRETAFAPPAVENRRASLAEVVIE